MKPSKFNKKYKALMLDIDGTLVPYGYSTLPSEKIKNAIKKAQEKLTVCIVTGRAYNYAEEVLKSLEINKGLIVINNGANVINIATKEVIYDRPINLADAKKVVEVLEKENIPFRLKETYFLKLLDKPYFTKGKKFKKAYMIYTDSNLLPEKADEIINSLSHLSDLNIHRAYHKSQDKFGITATHINATKTHGIFAIEKKLKIKKADMIGVGDGYNDFPLLMACGLKIAMGNAIPDLKEIADYIAPSVENDGVADIIEKFVLKNEK